MATSRQSSSRQPSRQTSSRHRRRADEPDHAANAFMAAMMERYTMRYDPMYVAKLRWNVPAKPGFRLGLNWELGPPKELQQFQVQLRPGKEQKEKTWWDKLLVIPDAAEAHLDTRAINFGFMRLKFRVSHSFQMSRSSLNWRVHTKWGGGLRKVDRKEPMPMGKNVCLVPHWRMKYDLPTGEGGFHSGQDPSMALEMGYLDISVPRVDLKYYVDGHELDKKKDKKGKKKKKKEEETKYPDYPL